MRTGEVGVDKRSRQYPDGFRWKDDDDTSYFRFFFFQAEDGIRDIGVTGVQTCALPIYGIVNGTTNYILTEMARTGASYAEALADAQRLGYAEADPTDDVTGKDAAAKMSILARPAFDTPVSLAQVPHEGRDRLTSDDLEYARDLGLGLKLIGTAERVNGKLSVRVHPAFLYAGHPLASVHGPYNAVTVESSAITEITMSGPGAGGPQTASAVLGDVISAMIPPASTPETTASLELVDDVESAFYLYLEVADRPGVLAQVAQILGMQGASIKSVVQKGLGEKARLVMVVHPLLESRFFAARDLISRLDFVRAAPRAIRVIEEDRKSTRLNSSHANISYAVFCLKKKNQLIRTSSAPP